MRGSQQRLYVAVVAILGALCGVALWHAQDSGDAWTDRITDVHARTSHPWVKEILRDQTIQRDEYADAVNRLETCMADAGGESLQTLWSYGIAQFSVESTDESLFDQCTQKGFNDIEYLYVGKYRDPLAEGDVVVWRCLQEAMSGIGSGDKFYSQEALEDAIAKAFQDGRATTAESCLQDPARHTW